MSFEYIIVIIGCLITEYINDVKKKIYKEIILNTNLKIFDLFSYMMFNYNFLVNNY